MDRYVFRRAEKGIMGFYMDPEMRSKPITRAMMGKWISAVGKLSGFEHNTIAYSLRYMAGNSLDRDGTFCFMSSTSSTTSKAGPGAS